MESDAAQGEDLSSPAAFTRFYRSNLPTVFGYLLRLCGGDRSLAEDLTQDSFLALTAEIKVGHGEAADIRWLLVVARHKFVDHLRRDERGKNRLRLIASTAEQADDAQPTRANVLEQVARLQPVPRAVIMMRYIDGMPVESIAREIGRSLHATYSLLARARRDLRTLRCDDL